MTYKYRYLLLFFAAGFLWWSFKFNFTHRSARVLIIYYFNSPGPGYSSHRMLKNQCCSHLENHEVLETMSFSMTSTNTCAVQLVR